MVHTADPIGGLCRMLTELSSPTRVASVIFLSSIATTSLGGLLGVDDRLTTVDYSMSDRHIP